MNTPNDLERLCRDLGIGPNQLANLQKDDAYKDEQALIKAMQKWWKDTRDEPRLLGKTTGYVHSSAGALRVVQRQDLPLRAEDAGEAVDDLTQRRITAQAHLRDQAALGELLSAMEDVRAALDERVKANPDAAKIIGKELWQVRGRIDAAKARLKRRMAA